MRRPLEKHRDVAPYQRPLIPGAGFDPAGQVDDPAEVGRLEVGDVEEIPASKTAHR